MLIQSRFGVFKLIAVVSGLLLAPAHSVFSADQPAGRPRIKSFQINGGAAATSAQRVFLKSRVTGAATEYRAGENRGFKRVRWKTYRRRVPFKLSAAPGPKTVYFTVRSRTAQSKVAAASIELASSAPPEVVEFTLNGGERVTAKRRIVYSVLAVGSPVDCQVSESPLFIGNEWQSCGLRGSLALSPGNGVKTLYARLRNANGESAPLAAKITLKEPVRTILSQKIQPSLQDQTVTLPDRTRITIPAGTLSTATVLKVTKPASLSTPPTAALRTRSTLDITLGDLHDFSANPLQIDYFYDPQALVSGVEPEHQFYAAYFDSSANLWITLPVLVYRNENRVRVAAPHLSEYAVYQVDDGFAVKPGIFSRVVYSKFMANPRGIDVYAALVLKWIDDAIKGYSDSGFKTPAYQIPVFITGAGSRYQNTAEYGCGRISVPNHYAADEEVKFDVYHEVFHAVQDQYLGALDMRGRLWFIEATADYAAGMWSGEQEFMGEGIKFDFFKTGIESSTPERHMYHTAHFIHHLVRHGGASFKDLFLRLVEAGWFEATVGVIDGYLAGRGSSLRRAFEAFALAAYFDTNFSPMPAIADSLYSEVADESTLFAYSDREHEAELTLAAGFTAALWGIWVESDDSGYRYLKFTTDGELPEQISVYLVPVTDEINRSPGGGYSGRLEELTDTVYIKMWPHQSLYLMAVNSADEKAAAVIKATDETPMIESLSTELVEWGAPLTISGSAFGWDKAQGEIAFADAGGSIKGLVRSDQITSWNDTAITFPAPRVYPGDYEVFVTRRHPGFSDAPLNSGKKPVTVSALTHLQQVGSITANFYGTHSYNCTGSGCAPTGSAIDFTYGRGWTNGFFPQLVWNGANFSGTFAMTVIGDDAQNYSYSMNAAGTVDGLGKTVTALTVSQSWSNLTAPPNVKTYTFTGNAGWSAANLVLVDRSTSGWDYFAFTNSSAAGAASDTVIERHEVCANPPLNTVGCSFIRNLSRNYLSTDPSSPRGVYFTMAP